MEDGPGTSTQHFWMTAGMPLLVLYTSVSQLPPSRFPEDIPAVPRGFHDNGSTEKPACWKEADTEHSIEWERPPEDPRLKKEWMSQKEQPISSETIPASEGQEQGSHIQPWKEETDTGPSGTCYS